MASDLGEAVIRAAVAWYMGTEDPWSDDLEEGLAQDHEQTRALVHLEQTVKEYLDGKA